MFTLLNKTNDLSIVTKYLRPGHRTAATAEPGATHTQYTGLDNDRYVQIRPKYQLYTMKK